MCIRSWVQSLALQERKKGWGEEEEEEEEKKREKSAKQIRGKNEDRIVPIYDF